MTIELDHQSILERNNRSILTFVYRSTAKRAESPFGHSQLEAQGNLSGITQQKKDPKTIRSERTKRDEKPSQKPDRDSGNRNRGRYQNRPIEKAEGMAVSTWPDISHLSISRPELINVLRQMGQQVKWPQKMKAPDSFRNPGFWCDFHRDHGHKTEDCVALKIEVNELLKKGNLREFLSEKSKSHLSKETTGKPTEAAPVSPP
ncbi:hypothetical protein YC2023_010861 [Brassica napus]